MKRRINKFFSILLVICMILSMIPPVAVQAATPSTLYFKPNSNWTADSARFAAYFFGTSGEKWVSMSSLGNGYYSCSAPTSGYASVIVVRMDPSNTTNSWDAKWNQTADLTLPTDGKNCMTMTDGWWDSDSGSWAVYACLTGGHSYSSKTTTAATCTTTGVKTYTCSRSGCGDSYTETIAALGHSYAAATCTVAKKCSRCGTTSGSALGHSYTYAKNVSPTTSSTGSIKGTCSRCSGTTTVTLPALTTTNYTRTTTKAATCTATGTYTWTWKTTTYGTFSYTSSIAATGHSYAAATCTKASTCSTCGATTGSALGHSYTYAKNVAPTTSAAGSIKGTCSRCSGTTTVTLPALTTTNYTRTTTKAATCTATGTYTWTWKTTTYGTFSYTTSIAATGHSYGSATCTAAATCSTCGATTGSALGHSYSYAVSTKPTTSATGTLKGTCSRCSGTTTVTLPVLSTTNYTYTVPTAATCTATGTGRYTWKTTTYGTFYFDVTIAATGHSYTSKVTTAATCTTDGVRTYTCSNCSGSYTEAISATGHSYSGGKCGNCGDIRPVSIAGAFNDWSAASMTWGTSGYTYSVKLSAGSYEFKVIKDGAWLGNYGTIEDTTTATSSTGWEFVDGYGNCILNATGGTYNFTFNFDTNMLVITFTHTHSYTAGAVTAPTCTSKGYTTYTCACGDSYQGDETAATGHSWSSSTGKCSTCGTSCSHSWSSGKCSTCGMTCSHSWSGSTCSICGLGCSHSWNSGTVTTAATCTATGVKTYTCSTCKSTKTESIAALGHSYTDKVTAPTCTAQGYTTHTCSRCSNSYTDTYTNATGHSYTSAVTTAATCTTAGVKTYTCSKCSASYTEAIAALGHNYTSKVTAPTCTAQGYTTHTCSRCSDSYKDTYTDATGHSYSGSTCTGCGNVRNYYLWGYINGSDLENYDFKFSSNKYTLTATTDCYVAILSDSQDWYMTSGYPGDYVTSATLYNTNQGISDANKLFVPNGTTVVFTITVNTNETIKLSYTISSCSHLNHGTDGKCKACGTSVSHSWSSGTCTHCGLVCSHSWSSGKCSVCDVSCSHSWNSGTVTTAATCTIAGVKTYTCNTCGSTKTESIAATGHSYTSKVTAPTCTDQGYTTYTCSKCSDSYKDTYTSATGHSYDNGVVTKAATCTSDGVKTYTCSGCSGTKTETIAATGHSYTGEVTAPTCTAGGYTTYTCSSCGYSYTGNATSATGHSYNSGVVTKAATCTTAGVKTYTCSACKGTKTEEIPATGHSYSSKVTAPTCTASGYTTYTCSACGDSYTADETAATGHNHVAGTCTVCGDKLDFYLFGFINGGNYACEDDGSNLGSYKFTDGKLVAAFDCDSYVAVKTSDNNHWYMFQSYTETTSGTLYSTSAGAAEKMFVPGGAEITFTLTAGSGDSLVLSYEITSCSHSYGEGEVTKAPTCTAEGTRTYTCAICGQTTTEAIPATGHSYAGGTCTVCGNAQTYYLFGFINGADYAYGDDGSNLGVYKFVGGKLVVTFDSDSYVGVKTGDNLSWYMAQAYIDTNGGTLYNTSTGASEKMYVPGGAEITFTLVVNSDDTLTLSYIVSSCPHYYNEGVVTKAPTCTAEGVMSYTCAICGTSKTESIAATGHSYTTKVTAPTCTEQGYTTHTCSTCGNSYKDTYTTALSHSYTSKVTTAPTCTKAGVTTYTCSACSDSYTEEIPTIDHSYTSKVTAPTCTEKGYTTYTCSACGDSYTADETAATGHSYDNGVVTKAPTCTAEGVKTYTCSACKGTKTEAVAALGHSYNSGVVTAPTCTASGYTTYTCSACGDSYTADETAATGHNHVAGTCTVCGDKLDFYLFGFINGGNYACEDDGSNLGEYKFTGGKLVAAFDCDSYVAVKTSDNNHWYMFQSYTETTSGTLYNTSAGAAEKMFVPGGAEITFTLTAGEGDTLVLSYVISSCSHNWGEGAETKAPTCTEDGVRTYTCSICGESKTEAIPATGHNHVAGTCTVCGDKLDFYLFGFINGGNYACEDDGSNLGEYKFTDGKLVAAFDCDSYIAVKTSDNNHWYMFQAYTETTSGTLYSTSAGAAEKMFVPGGAELTFTLTAGEGDSLVLSYEITDCGHNYEAVVTAPTCTAGGCTTYTCTICGDSYVGDETAALGHNYVDGICSNCGDGCDHSYSSQVTKEPTCTDKGVKTYTCSKCAHSYTEEIAANGHVYDSVVTAPTCTEGGCTTYTCSTCGDSYTADETAALGHSYVAGTCIVCGDKLDAYLIGYINGADYEGDEYKFENGTLVVTLDADSYVFVKLGSYWYMAGTFVEGATSATLYPATDTVNEKLFVPGGAEITLTLSVGSGDSLVLSYDITSCAHNWGEGEITTAPTCTDTGVRAYTCSICGETKTEELAATGHSYVAGECTDCGTAQTYYLFGFINGADYEGDEFKFVGGKLVVTFTEAGYIAVRTGDKLGWYMAQEYIETNGGKLYNSTTTGATEKMYVPGGAELTFTLVANADDTLTLSYIVSSCPHYYNEGVQTKAPTCTAEGVMTYTCAICGTSKTEAIPVLGHSYEAVVTAPTCTEGGYTTYTCANCGDSYTADETEALGHNYVDGTCVGCGEAEPVVKDGYNLIGYIEGADSGTGDDWADCDSYWFTDTITVTFTMDAYVAVKKADNSTWYWLSEFSEANPTTFTVNGGSEKMKIPAGTWVITLTANEDGTVTLGYEAVPCEHSYEAVVTAPTCTEGGYTTYTCTACGDSYTADETEALGHNYVDGTCVGCGEAEPVVKDGYNLIGYIEGADSGTGDDWANCDSYWFTDTITVTFTMDAYVAVKKADNSTWYWLSEFSEANPTTFTKDGGSEKMKIPAGTWVITLTEGEDGTVTLGYEAVPCEHSYESVVTAPTCTEGGYTTYTCSACGDSYTADETAALGHNYVDGTCVGCGEAEPVEGEKITLYFDISSTYWENVYVYTWDADENPTDGTWPGTQMTDLGNGIWSCEVSADAVNVIFNNNNDLQTDNLTIPTDGTNLYDFADKTWKVYCEHSYGEGVVTAPTCTEGGYTTYTCSNCGDSYTADETEALGHNYVDGTCVGCGEAQPVVKDGYNLIGYIEGADSGTGDDWANCDSYWCTDTITVTFTMDAYVAVKRADNSTWYWLSEFSEANPTTFTADGGSEKMLIPAGTWVITLTANEDGTVTLGYAAVDCEHSYESTVTAPTCTVGGYTTYTCTLCGDTYTADETGATGHTYTDGTCSVCGAVEGGVVIHLVNTLGWEGVTGYFWTANGVLSGYDWPGQIINRDQKGYFTLVLDYTPTSGESLNMIFHNFNGGQTADITVSYATLNATRELWIMPSTAANSDGKYDCSVATAESDLVISPEINGTEVTFRYAGTASSVYLAGSMNGWSSSATAMTKDANGVWSVTLTLEPGVYEYKFVVDGSWIADPGNGVVGGYDGNNIAVVPGSELAPTGKITVVLHFYRASGDYTGWDVWFWDNNNASGSAVSFTADTLNKGMTATYTLDGGNNSNLGYVVRKSDWSDKEFYDRFIDLSYVKSGTVHFYLNSGSATGSVVYGTDVICEPNGQYANLDYESGTVWIKTSLPTTGTLASQFSIVDANGNSTGISVTAATLSGNGYTLTLSQRLSLIEAKTYKVKFNGCLTSINVNTSDLFYSSTFNSEYNYTGDDLGANWSYGSTTFKVWAPTANGVSVILYTSGNYGQGYYDTVAMTPGDKGVWSVTVSGNLHGMYYNYLVDHGSYTVEATDPYAKAAGVNGDRGMVVNLNATDPSGWDSDVSPNQGMSYTDAIIYEMHVREFTLDSNSGVKDAWRGKYLGLTQTGTTYNGHATALDYLKELGVTHVQLMPVYDFKSVDEYNGGYAWGYDPQNYNVPEGSYSTDPYNGDVRITEFKEMVQTFHENGINVVMDVVYNHAFDGGNFCYNKIVPNYFSRFYGEGNWSNGSGCGNDMATERVMARNYIVDSIMHWVEEYHIDGFRFDLAGLIDTQTINEIVNTVHAKYPYVMFYGEGWAAGDTAVEYGYSLATKGNAWQTSGFGYFNDDFRNAIAGDNGNSWGFASGSWDYADRIASFFRAGNSWANSPSQSINYVSAHDNYCLTDKLLISRNGAYWDEITRMNALAGSVVLLSEGVPFLYSGDEMLREKLDYNGNRVENGFSGGDYANQINWANLTYKEFADRTSDYYAGLIEFRKNHAALRCANGSDAWNYVSYYKISDQTILLYVSGYPNYECSDGIVIIYNASSSSVSVNLDNYNLPSGYWQACIHGTQAGVTPLWGVNVGSGTGTIGVDGISTTVLVLGDLVHEESIYNTQASNCDHISHNTSGMCTSCGKTVSHSYSGGVCSICGLSQSAPSTYTVYYDNSVTAWDYVNIYAWTKTAGLTKEYTGQWSGSAMTLIDEANGIYAYELPIGATNIIFNGSGGQSPDLTAPGYTSDATLYSNDGTWITYDAACDHSYTDTYTIPVTCTADGEVTHTCDLCGYSYSEVVEAPGHIYESAVTDPTCTEWGYTTYTCTGCGKTYNDEYVANLRHNYVDGTCDVCGTVKAYYLFGYINGSNYACEGDIANMGIYKFVDGTVKATFTAASYVAVKTIDNEDWYMTDGYQENVTSVTLYNTSTGISAEKLYVPAGVEVTFTLVVNEDDTLTLSYATDLTTCEHLSHGTGGICTVCGQAVKHTYEAVITAPTCTEDGYTTHKCSVCGDSYTDTVVESLGHTFADGICKTCGAIDPATCEHVYEAVVTEPTCEQPGYTTHTCPVCGDSYVDTEVEALGHSYVDGVCETCGEVDPATCEHTYESVVTEPTCTEAGYTTHTCTACGDSYTDSETEALGHSYESVVTEPTCIEAGYTTHTCSKCGDSYTDTETGALGHSYVDGVCETCGEAEEEAEAVTLYYDNSSTAWSSVRVTAETETGETTDIEMTHLGNNVWTYTLPAGTTSVTFSDGGDEDGNTSGGRSEKQSVPTRGTGKNMYNASTGEWSTYTGVTCEHSYGAVVTAPTCTEAGYTTYTCSKCGGSYVGDETEALGHSFVDGTCSVCGAIDPATCEHTYESVVTAPTCTEGGYTTYTCSICGDSYVGDETEPADHSYVDGVCEICGEVNPCEHEYESVVTDPTCEEAGYTTHTCTLCGDSYTDTETEALGHSFVDGICEICGAVDMDSCEHVYESVVVAPTCEENGCTKYTCSLCGHSYEDTVVEATGHTYSDGRCTICRAPKPLSTDYYLVGWINGGNYGCEEDGDNMGIYKFENNVLKATFDQSSYVFVKTAGNANWYMCDGYPGDGVCSANLYNTSLPIQHDKVNVPGSVEITFTLIERDDGSLTMTYVKAGECPHDYYSYTSWWPGCTTTGEETYRCILCADTYTKTLPATGHNYSGAYCTNCGADNPYYYATYYLVGYINGGNYACEEDWANTGSYKFVNGRLTATFDCDSYVYVKTGDNAKWYMAQSYIDSGSGTLYNTNTGAGEKMFVPGGRQITFYLTVNGNDTLSLSYTAAACSHDYSGSYISTQPGCTTTGVRTYYCTKNCGSTYDEVIPATGHNYVDGACAGCGDITADYVVSYYLFGWINGGNYGCEDDRANMGEYKFVDGKLVATFEQDSYIAVKTSGNLNWYMAQSFIDSTSGTLYNTSTGAAEKMFVPGGAELVFTLTVNANDTVTVSYINASACSHNYVSEVTTQVTCGTDGVTTYTCSKCGLSYTETIAATGEHNFVDGCCTVCHLTNEEYVPEYYLFGYINGADYGCNADSANMGQYKFVDGKLTATFDSDSYVAVKTSGNAYWYMAQAYVDTASGTLYNTSTGASEKMFVPGGKTLTFTLTVNEDGTLTLSYAEGVTCEHSYTGTVTTDKTCDTEGLMTYTCDLCGDTYTEAIPAGHTYTDGVCQLCGHVCEHSYTAVEVPIDCVTIPHTLYTCSECGHSYKTYADELKTEWLETLPEGIDPELVESKQQYRFALYQTMTSFEAGLEGYDLIGSAWVNPVVGSNLFVAEWPAGFDTTNELYAQYSNKVEASETETEKVELGEEKLAGYLYFHWCGNGVVSDVRTEECTTFHAFYSTAEGEQVNEICELTEWYTAEVYEQTYTTSQNEFTYGCWGEWSEWSDESTEASDTCKTEERTVSRYVDVELPEHTYESVIEDATCTESGSAVHSCTVCGDTYTETLEATGHSYVDGTCEVCGEAKPITAPTILPLGASLAFKDEIYYNVYFGVSNPDNVEIVEMGLMTWTSAIDGTIETAEYVLTGTEPYGTDYLKARSQAIAAKNMAESLYMKVYLKLADGTYIYSSLLDYSAKTYATNKLATSKDAKLKALCVALMNYGAAAQLHFGHNTENLMNADLTAEQQALVEAYSDTMVPALVKPDAAKIGELTGNGGYSALNPSVNFGGAFGINYIFKPSNAVEAEMKLYVWTKADYEAAETLTLENAFDVLTMTDVGDGSYTARVTGIAAKNAGDTVYVCGVYESEGVTYMTGVLEYSVSAYCKNLNSEEGTIKDLTAAAGVYIHYAREYLLQD